MKWISLADAKMCSFQCHLWWCRIKFVSDYRIYCDSSKIQQNTQQTEFSVHKNVYDWMTLHAIDSNIKTQHQTTHRVNEFVIYVCRRCRYFLTLRTRVWHLKQKQNPNNALKCRNLKTVPMHNQSVHIWIDWNVYVHCTVHAYRYIHT